MTSKDSEDRNVVNVVFGAQQRRLRTLRGISKNELAEELGYSADLIRKIERGQRRAQPEYVMRADELLDAHGVLIAAAEELSQLQLYPEWFAEYVETEGSCLSLHSYNTHVIHGLLQTEDYARAVLSAHYPMLDEDEVQTRVVARLDRQAVLTRKPACMLSFVIEEWVLQRPVGGRSSMKEQIRQLADRARMRNITVQVMPTAQETHAGFDGAMTLLETEDNRKVGYIEYQGGRTWVSKYPAVSTMEGRYGTIRTQALNAEASLRLLEKAAEEL